MQGTGPIKTPTAQKVPTNAIKKDEVSDDIVSNLPRNQYCFFLCYVAFREQVGPGAELRHLVLNLSG